MVESMNQPATLVRALCLSPARAKVAIDAPLGTASYARMFPELPSFQADEQFLRALGRAGGVCDCVDVDDSPDSLGDTAAGWPIFGQFVAHDITADRSILRAIPIRRNYAIRAARNSTLSACTATGPPAIRSSTSVTTRRSFCLVWMEQTYNETQRASQSSATHETILTC